MRQGEKRGRRLVAGLAIAIALVVATPRTLQAAELRWNAPADCDRAPAVTEQVESLVGRPLASVPALGFEATIRHEGDDWKLVLVTDANGVLGQKALAGRSCVEVTDAAAVVMAMAIRAAAPEQSAPAPEPEAPPAVPPPEPTPAPRTKVDAGAPKAPPAARSPPLQAVLGVSGALDTAALPAAAFGVAVVAAARWSHARFEAQGTAFLPRTVAFANGQSAEFSLLAAALLMCAEGETPAVTAVGCGGFELGRMSGEGRGVSDPRLGDALWDAPRVEVGAAYPLGPLRVAARMGLAIPLSRPDFQLDGKDVHRPAALTFRAQLGVELSP